MTLATALPLAARAAQCGECWCVPGNGGSDPCPDWHPQDNFPAALLADLKAKKLTNPYADLECDPYHDDNCFTSPGQEFVGVDSAVCAFVYDDESCGTYALKTFAR